MSFRQFVLILLVFLPAALATLFFMGWDREERDRLRVEEGGAPTTEGSGGFALSETEGRRIFVVRSARSEVDGSLTEYPRRYYFFETVAKQEADVFLATGIAWIENPPPKTAEDVENLLIIRTTDGAAAQVRAMQDAAPKFTGGRAAEGTFAGGSSLDTAEDVKLRGGVDVHIERPDGESIDIRAEGVDAGFTDGELSRFDGIGAMRITKRGYDLRGSDLDIDEVSGAMTVRKDVDLRIARGEGDHARKTHMSGGGPLVFTPSAPPDPAVKLLDRISVDAGTLTLDDLEFAEFDRFRILGRRMTAVIEEVADRDDPEKTRTRFRSFTVEGNVTITSVDGLVTGELAHVDIGKDGDYTVRVEGERVEVKWMRGATAKDKEVVDLLARSSGPLVLHRPKRSTRGAFAYRITMSRAVRLELDAEEARALRVDGDELEVWLDELPSNRLGAKDGETTLRLARAVLDGNVKGEGTDLAFGCTHLEVKRVHDGRGLLVRDDIDLTGPAVALWRQRRANPDGATDVARTLGVDAHESISVARAASPFADSTAVARGEVAVRLTEKDGNKTDKLDADEVELVLTSGARSLYDRRLSRHVKRLEATRDVVVTTSDGRTLKGAWLLLDDVSGNGELTGSPAEVTWTDDGGETQWMRAPRFHVARGAGTLTASEGVAARVELRPIDLFELGARGPDLPDRGPFGPKKPRVVPWDVTCDTLVAATTPTTLFGQRPAREPGDRSPKGTRGLRHVRFTGSVSGRSALQSVVAEEMFYDLRDEQGWATGSPVRVEAREASPPEGREARVDWVTAPKMVLRRETVLLEGSGEAEFWVRKGGGAGLLEETAAAKPRDPRAPVDLERVHVKCHRDIVIERDVAWFSGRTLLERGDPERSGVRLECNSAVLRFAAPKSGKTSIARLEGYDDVKFRTGELSGEGDLVVFDREKKIIDLTARKGTCRMTHRRLGNAKSARVRFDIEKQTLRGYGGARGEVK